MKLTELSTAYAKVHLPAKVVLAVTETPDGGYNMITLEWFMRTSIQPPMFAISIGHSRFSHDCLEANRYFNLVFPSHEMKSVCSLSGSRSGRDIDKLAETGVKHIPGRLRKLPVLTDAVAVFECEVVTQVRSGDHTIYVGEVKHSWMNDQGELLVYKN